MAQLFGYILLILLLRYTEAVANLILKAIKMATATFGIQPTLIVTPYSTNQVQFLSNSSDTWAIVVTSTTATFDNHYPSHPLLQFWREHPVIFPKVTRQQPIAGAMTIFTDGSSNGTGAMAYEGQVQTFLFPSNSAQHTELSLS